MACNADDPETGEFVGNKEFDNYNEWRLAYIEYSKEYVVKFNGELNTDIKFLELDSPREYNFETDVIICEVSRKDIIKIQLLQEARKDKEFAFIARKYLLV